MTYLLSFIVVLEKKKMRRVDGAIEFASVHPLKKA